MWITLDQIECLQAIQEKGSINAASETLNKAKSAVSYTIKKLEEQLGFSTLDRSEYRIKLTPQGEAFLVKARPLLKDFNLLEQEVHKIANGVEMKVAISATAIYPTQKLHSVLKSLMQEYPSTEITFHREILSGEKMVMDESVDIGIFENLQNSIDLEGKKISDIQLKLVIAANHPFLDIPKEQQSIHKLLAYPHIIQRSTIQTDGFVGSPDGAKRWTVSDIDSKKELIIDGLGWGRLPDHFVAKELEDKRLVHLDWLNYDHYLDIFICRKKSKNMGPVLRHIWDSFS